MRIYMIDRNIASKISSNFKNCDSEDKNYIKSLDTKGSVISLLLANIEGRLGIPQDMNQASFGMLAEGDVVKSFFKKARVDAGFFETFNNLASWGVCSGLMYPDTDLGENARHGEVFDEQAKTYVFP